MSANRNSRSNRSHTLNNVINERIRDSPGCNGNGIGGRGRARRNLNLTRQLSLTTPETGPNNHEGQIDSLITRRVSSSSLIEPEFDNCYIPQIVKNFQNNHELKELLRKGQVNEFPKVI